MKRSEAAKLWAMFATAYAEGLRWLESQPVAEGRTQFDETAALYQGFLLDLDYAAADAAVRRLIATWLPTSANRYPPIPIVRAAVFAQQAGRPLAGGEAWGVVQKLIGRYGMNRTPGGDFDVPDSVAARCIEALGWRELCQSENATADRARFIELYDRLAGAAQEDAVAGALAPPLPRRMTGMGIAALLPALPKERT